MFEINHDTRMTTEEKLLFNIQETLKEISGKLDKTISNISCAKPQKLEPIASDLEYPIVNISDKSKKKG